MRNSGHIRTKRRYRYYGPVRSIMLLYLKTLIGSEQNAHQQQRNTLETTVTATVAGHVIDSIFARNVLLYVLLLLVYYCSARGPESAGRDTCTTILSPN